MSQALEKPAPYVPRWLVCTIWTLHRAAYSITGGRFGLRTRPTAASGCPGPVPFAIVVDQPWLSTTPSSSTLTPGAPLTIAVVVDRSGLAPGVNVGHLVIASGKSSIEVTVEAIRAT